MDISKLLKYEFNSRHLNAEANEKKIFNIKAFNLLSRKGLKFEKLERRLLLYKNDKEPLYIQYPGKETARNKNEKSYNAWDMRPELYIKNERLKGLSFNDIWDDMARIHNASEDALSLLGATFFHMAYMINYKLVDEEYKYEDVDMITKKVVDSGKIKLKWYKPNFDDAIYDYFQKNIKIDLGMSFKTYIYYNDLLVQNEDCKYSMRAERDGKAWDKKVGRLNTMLTHLSVIQFISGKSTFSEIMGRFQRGRGVAPIAVKYVTDLTNGLIVKS